MFNNGGFCNFSIGCWSWAMHFGGFVDFAVGGSSIWVMEFGRITWDCGLVIGNRVAHK